MKIAQLMVTGFEDVEAFTTIDLLRRAQIEVDTISLSNERSLKSARMIEIKCDKLFKDVELVDYDGFILAGGPGTNNYYKYEDLQDELIKAHNEHKLIAAICAAPSYLASIGLLKKLKATAFPKVINILADNEVIVVSERVVVDKNIITAQALGSAIPFALAIIEYLLDQERAEKIKAEICY